MNSKIYNISKFSTGGIKRTYSAFVADEFGDWEILKKGTSSYSSAKKNELRANFTHVGNGAHFSGNVTATRTIQKLKRAKSINFTFHSYRSPNNVWTYSGGWNGYIYLLGEYVKVQYKNSGYNITVNENVICELSEKVTYDITFKQNCLYLDGVKYTYPEGTRLSNATSDICSAYSYMGLVYAGGYASAASLYVLVGDICVKW